MSSDPLAGVSWLPGVAEAVAEARAAVDALRGHRVLRRYGEKVSAESALRGARASAALEGADLPLDVVRRTVQAGGRLPEAEDALVRGALRVAAAVGPMQDTWRRAPLQVLARLHTLAASGLAGSESLGRPRPDPAVSARLTALGSLLTSPTDAPALVVAAVVHGELLSIGAFEQANGVVARATGRLVLVTRGLDPTAVSVPEVGHVELGAEAYARAAEGYATGGTDGVAGWVIHVARACMLGAREGVAVCEAIQRGA
jgi:Fic family protein